MNKHDKKIDAIRKFAEAHRDLLDVFDNDTMQEYYPFEKSFDEYSTPICNWMLSSVEKLDELSYAEKRKAHWKEFISSRVEMCKAHAEKMDIDPCGHKIYLYLNGYYIEVTKDGSFSVVFNNESGLFNTLLQAEEFIFEFILTEYFDF
jgi:hypothetical protein